MAGPFSISENVEEVLQFNLAPSSIAAASNSEWFVTLDQREKPLLRAARLLKSGEVAAFPATPAGSPNETSSLQLDALEAISVSASGIVWMLDNGRRQETPPKLIGWNADKNKLHRVIYLSPPAVVPGSFCADLALDPEAPFAYIADPAKGSDAALIVVDLETGLCRRILSAESCVRPDAAVALPVSALSGRVARRIDGTTAVTQCGTDALAIDRRGEWLYFSALQSRTLYRIPTRLLRNPETKPLELVQAVETYAAKPPSIGLAIDSKGNLYLGDTANRGIGIIDAKERSYHLLVSDARLLWPDGLTFGHDGRLYFFSPKRAFPRPGDPASTALKSVYSLFRTPTPASGRPGD